MSEQELRDRLHASVDSIEAPVDLATRAEHGWRRRRRNAVIGAGLVVLAVTGGVVAALPHPAPAPVAAPRPAGGPGCAELPAPAPARPATDLSGWTYRGDPRLEAVVRTLDKGAVPLLGSYTVAETSPGTFAYALALKEAGRWVVRIGTAEPRGGRVVPIAVVQLPLPADGLVSAFVRLRGGFFAGSAEGALVALGPAGTQRINYAGCRDGTTFDTGVADDFLVLTTGPLEEAGSLTTQVDGRLVEAGRPQDLTLLPLAEPRSPDLTGHGQRLASVQLTLLADDRRSTVRFSPDDPDVRPAQVVVLGVCSGRGSVRFESTALPCDGRTHQVGTGTGDYEKDSFDVTAVPDPSTGRTSLSLVLTVAGR